MSAIRLSVSFVLSMCPQLTQVEAKLWVERGRVSKIITLELHEKTSTYLVRMEDKDVSE